MRFLSIVKSGENQGPPPQALLDAMAQVTEASIRDRSRVQTGGLAPSSAGARVQLAAGKLAVTNGPFTEAKEVIGGYAILEPPSRTAAIEATRRFLELHRRHWPAWQGECELHELVYLAP